MSQLKVYLSQHMTKMRKKEVTITKRSQTSKLVFYFYHWKESSSLFVQLLNQKPFAPLMGIKTFICSSMYVLEQKNVVCIVHTSVYSISAFSTYYIYIIVYIYIYIHISILFSIHSIYMCVYVCVLLYIIY